MKKIIKLKQNITDTYNKNKPMKKRVIRMNESDVERLVTRIIKEENGKPTEPRVGVSTLKKQFQDQKSTIGSQGLLPQEREILNSAIEMLTNFFSQSGNQAVGRVLNKFNLLKKELIKLNPKIEPTGNDEEGSGNPGFGV